MTLASGTMLGPYEILSPLGAGGMGEVYRARDTKLKRDVAIKVLPEAFAQDTERMKRFEREAQVLASLNHPNIAAIYGLEQNALVLELVEGPTLAERIQQRPLPLEEALAIAKQIAEGLEAAHEKGVIHRDLKPANVKLTSKDDVKILDFGLAKALEGEQAALEDSNSPTMTRAATAAGVLLGTAAYMSPEQARGKSVDKRADVWAFGCLLYEMLTVKRLFEGETVSDTLAAVLTREPDWTALPAGTPASVRRALARCLERDLNNRFHDIADVRIEMSEPLKDATESPAMAGGITRPRPAFWVSAAVVFGAVAGVLLSGSRPEPPAPVYRFALSDVRSRNVAISRDGRWLAYRRADPRVRDTALYIRGRDEVEGRAIPGTSNARYPFFSPDGSRIALFERRQLSSVSVTGGAPQPIPGSEGLNLGFNDRGLWLSDDTIVFASTGVGMFRMPAAGGNPTALTSEVNNETHLWPDAVPGGDAVVYTVISRNAFRIEAVSLESGEIKVVTDGAHPRVSRTTGHLLFWRPPAPTLLAAPFDLERLELTGDAVPLVDNVAAATNSGEMQFSLSDNGVLTYRPGTGQAESLDAFPWIVDRQGNESRVFEQTGSWGEPRLSPDGRALLIREEATPNCNLWVYDFARSTLTRVTLEGDNHNPLWMPDGARILYHSQEGRAEGIVWQPADGSGEARVLLQAERGNTPQSVSPDGSALLSVRLDDSSGQDLWVTPLDGSSEPHPFLVTDFGERQAVFSPDGRRVAYASDVSGRSEIYVRPYPGPGSVHQISSEGGEQPRWSRDGRELFFVSGSGLMAVTIRLEPKLSTGRPELVFEGAYDLGPRGSVGNYDVFPDGQRFLMMKSAMSGAEATTFHVVVNWPEALLGGER